MTDFARQYDPELEAAFFRLYRDFFDLAERRRRWSLANDIPWAQCNRGLDPAVADVVESFCAVELYLPDYLGRAMSAVAAQPCPGVVLRQLGLRGVQALPGPGRLAAPVRAGAARSRWPTWRARSSSTSGSCRTTATSP